MLNNYKYVIYKNNLEIIMINGEIYVNNFIIVYKVNCLFYKAY
jgi:hypothetical protein